MEMNCLYCQTNSIGQHEWNCPNKNRVEPLVSCEECKKQIQQNP